MIYPIGKNYNFDSICPSFYIFLKIPRPGMLGRSRDELFHKDPEYFYCKITFWWQKDKTLKNNTYVKRIKAKRASFVNHVLLYIGDLTILGKHCSSSPFFFLSLNIFIYSLKGSWQISSQHICKFKKIINSGCLQAFSHLYVDLLIIWHKKYNCNVHVSRNSIVLWL